MSQADTAAAGLAFGPETALASPAEVQPRALGAEPAVRPPCSPLLTAPTQEPARRVRPADVAPSDRPPAVRHQLHALAALPAPQLAQQPPVLVPRPPRIPVLTRRPDVSHPLHSRYFCLHFLTALFPPPSDPASYTRARQRSPVYNDWGEIGKRLNDDTSRIECVPISFPLHPSSARRSRRPVPDLLST